VKVSFRVGDQIHTLELQKNPVGYRATLGERTYDVVVVKAESGEFHLQIDGQPLTVYWAAAGPQRWVSLGGNTYFLDKRASLAVGRPGDLGEEKTLRAPMPGQVRAVEVAAGDFAEKGQTLVLLEAMKMEIRIQAPSAGRIGRVLVKFGETVEREQILVEIM
jgi:acetyl/propionyl-CoA carboxylase alpha subunit